MSNEERNGMMVHAKRKYANLNLSDDEYLIPDAMPICDRNQIKKDIFDDIEQ